MTSLNKKDATSGIGKRLILPTEEEWKVRADRICKLLNEWAADESGYEEETWPVLKKALDEDRPSDRKLFNDH